MCCHFSPLSSGYLNLLMDAVAFIQQIHSLNQPTIKHNVKSLITNPSKHPHSMPQLEAMERVKYEESKAVRHTSVVNSTTSVLRSTHQEASKSQLSPGMYEDSNARRTPVNYSTNSVSRGSPMLGRVPEGMSLHPFFVVCFSATHHGSNNTNFLNVYVS